MNEAQRLADAGDPDYTWQLDPELAADAAPWGAEIFARFIEEELGWEEFIGGYSFSGYLDMGAGGGVYEGVTVHPLCARPDEPPEPPVRGCTPRDPRVCADDRRAHVRDGEYQCVPAWASGSFRDLGGGPMGDAAAQVRPGLPLRISSTPSSARQVEQVVPPSDAEVTALLQAFLRARVDGEGAEQYLLREPEESPFEDTEVPLLYATTSGAPYERSEIERVQGPVWPNGWMEYKVRLFAEGETVVEQYFHVVRQ